MMGSLRAIGYSFNTAVADIIDNSIAAGASRVDISFSPSPVWFSVLDNGTGMGEEEIINAMRHGAAKQDRSANDLGRFGLGLKTASLSQCRRLTVVSLKAGQTVGARWDLDEVERHDDWILSILGEEDCAQLPSVRELAEAGHGTVVLWELLDRATAGEGNPADALTRLVVESADHLSLVFHRYLSLPNNAFQISVNRRPIEALDPFLRTHAATEAVGVEKRLIEGHWVVAEAFVLPHISKLTPEHFRLAGGSDRLRDSQGFYVYRNRRLITWGTWFRLVGREELSRLARIQIDIPNGLDHLWNLDVKKSTAAPPEAVRAMLKQIVDVVAGRSTNVFKEKRRRAIIGAAVIYMWERTKIREGVRYDVNRNHPLIAAFECDLSVEKKAQFLRLLAAVEESLPARMIYEDQARDVAVSNTVGREGEEVKTLLTDILASITSSTARHAVLASLSRVEPFCDYQAVLKTFTKESP